MLLAATSSDGTARCAACGWREKAPTHRREGREKILLSGGERVKMLEDRLLHHLKVAHDRQLLTKEEKPSEGLEGAPFPRAYYFGRRL